MVGSRSRRREEKRRQYGPFSKGSAWLSCFGLGRYLTLSNAKRDHCSARILDSRGVFFKKILQTKTSFVIVRVIRTSPKKTPTHFSSKSISNGILQLNHFLYVNHSHEAASHIP